MKKQVSKPQQNLPTTSPALAKREQPAHATKAGNGHGKVPKSGAYEPESLNESEEVDSDEEHVQTKKSQQKSAPAPVKQVAKPVVAQKNALAPAQVPRKTSQVSQASKKSSVHQEAEDEEEDVPVATQKKVKTQMVTPVTASAKTNSKFDKARQVVQESEEEADSIEEEDQSEGSEEEEAPAKHTKQAPAQAQINSAPQGDPEVIVSGVPFNATENDIRNHFKACKTIQSVKIMMGQDGRPRGKCFIKFTSHDDMNKAIGLSNGQFNGRTITVEQTRPRDASAPRANGSDFGGQSRQSGPESTNVIVRNLSFTVDEQKIRDHFSGCGDIKAVRIMLNEEGRSKGFGFVDFFSVDSARSAIKKQGEQLDGREINVDFSLPRGPGGYQGKPNGGSRGGFGGSRGGYGGSRGGSFGNDRRGFKPSYGGDRYD